jgi:SAM-dependent MidA family methyltransferase
LVGQLDDLPLIDRYTTEVNLDAAKWAGAVAAKIERGWALTIDYGFPRDRYYLPERRDGTLECYSAHTRGLDPLATPGLCDLTAHVDFTALAKAWVTRGMQLTGYTDQHHFLTGLVSQAMEGWTPSAREALGLKTLLHPEMMGTAFKVLAASRNVPEQPLSGFKFAREPRRELGLPPG